ncbi:MAG: hypothetical protein KIS66_01835 [Fimbriimonadaceae bacterium]|nr:hypothetical protein [Fimbriimonadaceae bacterium]
MLRVEQIAVFIPIIALLIPIVAILSAHQQKMARIFAERQNAPQSLEEISRLRAEVYELKQLVHQQTIQMDSLLSLSTRPTTPSEDVPQRIG